MFDLYEGCGIVYQIEKYLAEETHLLINWNMKARLAEEKYFERLEEEKLEAFIRTDWQSFFAKNTLIPLTEEVRASIIKIFDSLLEPIDSQLEPRGYIDGINQYVNWLVYLDTILSWFLYNLEETAKNDDFQEILAYYRFLRSEVEARHYLIPEPWNVQPLERYYEKHFKKKSNRPKCVECQSDKVVSNGTNWLCKECGRQWRKVSRKKAQ